MIVYTLEYPEGIAWYSIVLGKLLARLKMFKG